MKPTDITIRASEVQFLPVRLRVPLKFGAAVLDSIVCARVKMTVANRRGQVASGWGETPLSVGWSWPDASLAYEVREQAMIACCRELNAIWSAYSDWGHPMELSRRFTADPGIPQLAGLICNSAFDLALHDAYGRANGIDCWESFHAEFMTDDLAVYFGDRRFQGRYPQDYLTPNPPERLPVWHLVGGKDPLDAGELSGDEPDDGYPVTLEEWIERDGLDCLKIKLTGTDAAWDLARTAAIGKMALAHGVHNLSCDFNCMVREPEYVNDILDRLRRETPEIYDRILYVEQPFPYDLEANRIDVHAVAARKPLFMDESAHDWQLVKLGHELGWNGVALKVCKTLTGALLSACWAREAGMQLMVQDLTNPMLAMIPHVQLARYVGTIMGVECNAPQFYPEASLALEARHPNLYRRRNGVVELGTLSRIGLGYDLDS